MDPQRLREALEGLVVPAPKPKLTREEELYNELEKHGRKHDYGGTFSNETYQYALVEACDRIATLEKVTIQTFRLLVATIIGLVIIIAILLTI